MATETVTATINGQAESEVNILELISGAARDLPLPAINYLLSTGVCAHCVFRLFGILECVYSSNTLSMPLLLSSLKKVVDNGPEEDTQHLGQPELVTNICRICLGILQFVYQDDKNMLLHTNVCANDFAASIVEFVNREGHTSGHLSLEVSVPPTIADNEQQLWLYVQKKYCSESWFLDNLGPTRISVKEVLKLLVTDPLQILLDIKSGNSSPLRIRLTYTNGASVTKQNTTEKTGTNKRRKTGTDDSRASNGSEVDGKENVSLKPCNGSQHNESPELPYFQLEKVSQPCSLSVSCSRNAVYIGGRYFKYSRNVSQTRWVIDDERVGEASVEEIIGSNILPVCGGDSYKFHAAGREDIDVRMLGSGRPFLIEIQNARHVPSETAIKAIEEKINSLDKKLIGVKNVKEMGSQGWDLMREGESEKQKQYAAVVWISRLLEDDDLNNLSSLKDMPILQKTPIRVLHRRSPLERPRIIHWMKIERISGSHQYFLLHLCTQAGTYIKEFVHGDLGRTHPSIGSILGCRAEILQLDVTDVKMDCFLSE